MSNSGPRGWTSAGRPAEGGWIAKQRGNPEPIAPPANPYTPRNRSPRSRRVR